MPYKTPGCTSLQGGRHDLRIVVQRANDRMLVEERERLLRLLIRFALQQLAERAETIGGVGKSDFTSLRFRRPGLRFRKFLTR